MSLLSKTLKTAELGLQHSIIYKNNFLLGFITEALSLIVQLVFWPVFFSSGSNMDHATIEKTTIAGYYLNEMITYSLLVFFIKRGNSMMNIGGAIKNDIKTGSLNIHLIRPVKYILNKWVSSISGQLINFGLSLFVFCGVIMIFKSSIIIPASMTQCIMTIMFVFFSYIISFLIHCILGLTSFWLLEIGALSSFINMGISILSGSIFPIDMIEGNWGWIIKYLPFSYLAYFPTQIYLGKISADSLKENMIICCAWIVLLSLLANSLWKNGLRKYSAFGG